MKNNLKLRQFPVIFPLLIVFSVFIYVFLHNPRPSNNPAGPPPYITAVPRIKPTVTPTVAVYPTIVPHPQFLPQYSLVQPETLSSGLLISANVEGRLFIYKTSSPTETITPVAISKSSVVVYGHSASLIAYIEKSDPNVLKIYSTKSGNITGTFNIKTYLPISSISISPDNKSLFFMSNYNVVNRQSSVYSLAIPGGAPVKLFQTTATKISSLPGNYLLLFTSQDWIDKSSLTIINRSPPKNILLDIPGINFYHLSPNLTRLLTQSDTQIQVSSLTDGSEITHQISSGSLTAWIDDQTIITVEQTNNQLTLSLLNADSLSKKTAFTIPFTNPSQINQIAGVTNYQLLLTELSGKTWVIVIPSN